MNEKIRVALIYKKSSDCMTGTYFASTYFHFYNDALKRNKKLDLTYFPTDSTFDTSLLKDNFDVILLTHNHPDGAPDELIGIDKLKIPVIARVNDPHDAHTKGKIQYHRKYKIDHYFGYIPESFFHKYYPKNFKYKVILYGIEPHLYDNLKPFQDRIKDRVLCSGAAASTKFLSRTLERMKRFRGEMSLYKHYKLRTMCIKLPYVDYTSTLQHEFVGDKYCLLLSKYASAIAAHSLYPVLKYLETAASGCLTFMEVTDKNNAWILGFVDGENAIFINENNYKQKFKEYLSDPQNPRWKKIADAGRKYVLEQLNNDKAVDSLVDLMEKVISEQKTSDT